MKLIRFLVFVAIMLNIATAFAVDQAPRVLMIVNEGFWAPEHYKPREIFEKAGFVITVAAKQVGDVYPDVRNTEYSSVKADLVFNQVNLKNYDAIVFAGGNGAWTDYFPNEEVHRILNESLTSGKIVGLICSSTGLLGLVNNFDGQTPLAAGRKVTGYYRVRGLLEKIGLVSYDAGIEGKPHVVVDDKLVTGRDPISSELFGQILLKVILDSKK